MEVIIGIVMIIAIVLVIRLFGAWMLRIDELISNQKIIIEELKKGNSEKNKVS